MRGSSRPAQRILALLIAALSLVFLTGAFAQEPQAPAPNATNTAPPAANTAPAPAAPPSAPAAAIPAPVAANSAQAAAEEDIRDIRGPISIPDPWLWAAYAGGGLVLLALLFAAWRFYRRQSAQRAKLPFEIALERLEKARALMQPETAREYSFEVSEITRQYIEQRFHERAARRTTEEFLRDMLGRSRAELAAHRALLGDFLHHCDLAKFARWQLAVPEMEAMHASARAFIEKTKPAPPQATVVAAAPATNGSSAHAPKPASPRGAHTSTPRRP